MAARIAESMTRDSSIPAAPVVVEVEVLSVSGTSMYLFGRIPLFVCLEISVFPSIELCMAHAITTSVPGYIKKYVKDFSHQKSIHIHSMTHLHVSRLHNQVGRQAGSSWSRRDNQSMDLRELLSWFVQIYAPRYS